MLTSSPPLYRPEPKNREIQRGREIENKSHREKLIFWHFLVLSSNVYLLSSFIPAWTQEQRDKEIENNRERNLYSGISWSCHPMFTSSPPLYRPEPRNRPADTRISCIRPCISFIMSCIHVSVFMNGHESGTRTWIYTRVADPWSLAPGPDLLYKN